MTWAGTHGRIEAFGIEGTGSYGAGLAGAVRRAGHRVAEVNRGDRSLRRAAGKSDTLDAEAAARSVLAGQSTATPKTADGAVEMMRQLTIARDTAGGVIRLSPARSKTLVGRILPISQPIAEALVRRRARRDPDSPLVFHRDGIAVRRWRTAWRTACQAAGVPTRFLHDCRRTAARNLIRANVPERVAMLLTGHKSRASFDRYNIIHEQELLDAGDQLVAYLAQQAQAVPARRRSHAAGPAAPRTASPLRLVRRGTA